MPHFNGTGPRGMGPMTGIGKGYCVMRVPAGPHQTGSGTASHAKESRELPQAQNFPEAVSLQQQIGGLHADLVRLNHRLTMLEAAIHAQAGRNAPTESGRGRES